MERVNVVVGTFNFYVSGIEHGGYSFSGIAVAGPSVEIHEGWYIESRPNRLQTNDRFSELHQFRLTTSAIACDVVVVHQRRVTARDPEETGDPLSVGVTPVTMQQ